MTGATTRRWAAGAAGGVIIAVLSTGCTADGGGGGASPGLPGSAPPSSRAGSTPSDSAPGSAGTTPARPPRVSPDDVRRGVATEAVDVLAGEIGPRPGHTDAYFRAAAWVQRRLERLGWEVERQRFPTPPGVSWGVPVDGGPSVNLVATLPPDDDGGPRRRPADPWLAVGAHLDTVPQAPGAEDNASGVGTLLAVADALADARSRLPVTLLVFGSEEPRGPTDDDHHYGSRAYVASLSAAERASLRGMLALDRVGVPGPGGAVPVCSALAPTPLRADLLASARDAGVPATPCEQNRASDHWSFVREGLPGARLGSVSYAGYHSPGDVPSVVDGAQLERAARITLAWLA